MFNFLNKKNTSLVGVDISCAEVNLIEISFDKGRYCVEGFYRERLPINMAREDSVNHRKAVSECIRRARSEGHIQAKRALVAVPDAAVIISKCSVHAGLSEDEIEEYIYQESSLHLPYPLEGMNIDFQILGPSLNAVSMLDVLLVVSKTLTVNERVQAVKEAGLNVIVVDIESYALERAVRLLRQASPIQSLAVITQAYEKKLTVTGLINLSFLSIQLYVFRGSEVVFTREEIFNSQVSTDGVLLAFKRLLQFFFSTSQERIIDEFIIAGEQVNLANLQTLFEEQTGVSMQVADPLRALSVHPSLNQELLTVNSSALMLACGLALRELPCR